MSEVDELVRNESFDQATPLNILEHSFRVNYPHIAALEDPLWQDVLDSASVIKLPVGVLVMEPPTPCYHFMTIIKGCVRVYQQTPDDREVTLYRIYSGDLCVLSVNSLMHQADFGAFARTETEVEALTLSREQFMKAMAISRKLREFVLTNLTDRMHDVFRLVEDTVFQGLDVRLMCHLNRLSRRNGSDTLNITHQELARELGTSREVISRLLKGFERNGCIVQARGVIHLTT